MADDFDLDAIGGRRESRMFGVRGVLITVAERDALVAEVRRLRAEVEAAEATVEEAADDLHHFMQERDRLQAVLVDIAAAVPAAHRNDGRDVPERIREGAAAEAEVRRLRAALEAALIPAACIDKDDQAGDAVVQILLAAVREQDRG